MKALPVSYKWWVFVAFINRQLIIRLGTSDFAHADSYQISKICCNLLCLLILKKNFLFCKTCESKWLHICTSPLNLSSNKKKNMLHRFISEMKQRVPKVRWIYESLNWRFFKAIYRSNVSVILTLGTISPLISFSCHGKMDEVLLHLEFYCDWSRTKNTQSFFQLSFMMSWF